MKPDPSKPSGSRRQTDHAQELIEMEEDSEYDRAQEQLFHAHFEASELENASLKVRWAVDGAMRAITGKSFDANSERTQ
jgi:hypothetical protein